MIRLLVVIWFPKGMTPDIGPEDYAQDPRAQEIATAAKHLHELTENWVRPPELVRREPEVCSGYPDRILPISPAADLLKTRTLKNLYDKRPTWLKNAHRHLDIAVLAAYDWPADLTDNQILERLFELNQKRADSDA